MRLHIVTSLALLCLWVSHPALASSPGGACTVAGAQERDSGQILICNGSVWVETMNTVNAGRSLFQIGGAGEWSDIFNQNGFTCGLSSGSLYCWGANSNNQLGDNTTIDKYTPTKIGTDTWLSLANNGSWGDHTCALRADRRLFCWGSNGYQQIGNNTYTDQPIPLSIAGTDTWLTVSVGQFSTAAVRSDGTLWEWGAPGSVPFSGTPAQVGTATNWRYVSSGADHSCALKTDNTLWCWGADDVGQTGTGAGNTIIATPTQVGVATWKTISSGGYPACGIQTNDTLWCWGGGGYTGDGTNTQRESPVQIGVATWLSVDAGAEHVCAIRTNGTLWCWGVNWSGELGVPGSAPINAPVQAGTATNWRKVAAGKNSTCALTATNSLYCWGDNFFGQVGNGGTVATDELPHLIGTSGSSTCTTYMAGRLRYDSVSLWQYCNGTGWVDF